LFLSIIEMEKEAQNKGGLLQYLDNTNYFASWQDVSPIRFD